MVLAACSSRELAALRYRWPFWARPEQLQPAGHWSTWVVVSGRGFGKTRLSTEFLRARIEAGTSRRAALVGPTEEEVLRLLVYGESGLLAVCPPWNRPVWSPTRGALVWPNGATATVFSAREPDKIRGPEHDTVLADEVAAWRDPPTMLRQIRMGLRLGDPKMVITTTPKPTAWLRKELLRSGARVTRGSSLANAANLPDEFLGELLSLGDSTFGRQEREGEILPDNKGELFDLSNLKRWTLADVGQLVRVVVSVDPAVSTGDSSDETGVIAEGVDENGMLVLLADHSGKMAPERWAAVAIALFDALEADAIIAEINRGGDLVASTIRAHARELGREETVPVKIVRATRGKAIRAEPLSVLYKAGRVAHVGDAAIWAKYEQELVDFDPSLPQPSPNRLDAAAWGTQDLIVDHRLGGKPGAAVDASGPAAAHDPRLAVQRRRGRDEEEDEHDDDGATDSYAGAWSEGVNRFL